MPFKYAFFKIPARSKTCVFARNGIWKTFSKLVLNSPLVDWTFWVGLRNELPVCFNYRQNGKATVEYVAIAMQIVSATSICRISTLRWHSNLISSSFVFFYYWSILVAQSCSILSVQKLHTRRCRIDEWKFCNGRVVLKGCCHGIMLDHNVSFSVFEWRTSHGFSCNALHVFWFKTGKKGQLKKISSVLKSSTGFGFDPLSYIQQQRSK